MKRPANTRSVDTSTQLLTQEEAASLIGVQPPTLSVWRCNRRHGLPFVRIGKRFVRYRRSDVESFLERHTVGAT